MKLKRLYIQYRVIDSKIIFRLQRYRATTEAEAIEMARADWIENWNFSFPNLNNGAAESEKMVFEVIK